MGANKPALEKRYFTVAEANAALPLVRAIVRDIAELAKDLHERQDRLSRVKPPLKGRIAEAYQEELEQAEAEFERDRERLQQYEQELKDLGVELKDYLTGLIDFPCWMDNRVVYLCWRLGEPEVAFWHELDAGFAGRRRLGSRPDRN
jgi:hypothetical protein